MKKYELLDMDVIKFEEQDVIVTSPNPGGTIDLPPEDDDS